MDQPYLLQKNGVDIKNKPGKGLSFFPCKNYVVYIHFIFNMKKKPRNVKLRAFDNLNIWVKNFPIHFCTLCVGGRGVMELGAWTLGLFTFTEFPKLHLFRDHSQYYF